MIEKDLLWYQVRLGCGRVRLATRYLCLEVRYKKENWMTDCQVVNNEYLVLVTSEP